MAPTIPFGPPLGFVPIPKTSLVKKLPRLQLHNGIPPVSQVTLMTALVAYGTCLVVCIPANPTLAAMILSLEVAYIMIADVMASEEDQMPLILSINASDASTGLNERSMGRVVSWCIAKKLKLISFWAINSAMHSMQLFADLITYKVFLPGFHLHLSQGMFHPEHMYAFIMGVRNLHQDTFFAMIRLEGGAYTHYLDPSKMTGLVFKVVQSLEPFFARKVVTPWNLIIGLQKPTKDLKYRSFIPTLVWKTVATPTITVGMRILGDYIKPVQSPKSPMSVLHNQCFTAEQMMTAAYELLEINLQQEKKQKEEETLKNAEEQLALAIKAKKTSAKARKKANAKAKAKAKAEIAA